MGAINFPFSNVQQALSRPMYFAPLITRLQRSLRSKGISTQQAYWQMQFISLNHSPARWGVWHPTPFCGDSGSGSGVSCNLQPIYLLPFRGFCNPFHAVSDFVNEWRRPFKRICWRLDSTTSCSKENFRILNDSICRMFFKKAILLMRQLKLNL